MRYKRTVFAKVWLHVFARAMRGCGTRLYSLVPIRLVWERKVIKIRHAKVKVHRNNAVSAESIAIVHSQCLCFVQRVCVWTRWWPGCVWWGVRTGATTTRTAGKVTWAQWWGTYPFRKLSLLYSPYRVIQYRCTGPQFGWALWVSDGICDRVWEKEAFRVKLFRLKVQRSKLVELLPST